MSDWNDFGSGNNDNDDNEDYTDYDLDDIVFGPAPDSHALDLMWDAVKAGDDSPQWSQFSDYLYDFYGIDVDAEWDWIDFKEWYDAQ